MSSVLNEARRSDSKRIQFEFSADALERLNRLKEQANATSYAEIVRDALRLYEWFIEQQNAENDIGIVKDGKLIKTVKFIL